MPGPPKSAVARQLQFDPLGFASHQDDDGAISSDDKALITGESLGNAVSSCSTASNTTYSPGTRSPPSTESSSAGDYEESGEHVRGSATQQSYGSRSSSAFTPYGQGKKNSSSAATWGVDPWKDYKPGDFQLACTGAPTIPKPYMKRYRKGHPIETIKWNGLELVPVRKDFSYIEHPDVQDRSQADCERIRLDNSIVIVDDDGLDVPKPISSFSEIAFPEWAGNKIKSKGFQNPTGIQCQAWPIAMKGHDLIGIAETGSGKTLAYVLPMLIHIEAQPEVLPGEGPAGLVLVPNRELCEQVERQVNELSSDAGLTCLSVFGGTDLDGTEKRLERRIDIMVATPGVLIRLLEDRSTNLKRTTFLVLDEADELLSDGFEYQIRTIMSQVRPDRQVSMFSATWEDDSLRQLAREACSCRPIHINVGSTKLAACKSITQQFTLVGSSDLHQKRANESKPEALLRSVQRFMANSKRKGQAEDKFLVFCNGRETVPVVLKHLQDAGIYCEGFTADYSQLERENILKRFRKPDNSLSLLVCTHLLGRGHDFVNLRYVINYDMPKRMSEYVHRIGRCGRAGELGDSMTILEEVDLVMAKEIRECLVATKQKIPEWLHAACPDKLQRKFRAMAYAPSAARSAAEHEPTPAWKGRGGRGRWSGSARRDAWLEECEWQGATSNLMALMSPQ